MKLEYLLIKIENDFCSTKEEFINLLLANKRLHIDEEQINILGKNVGLHYSLKSQNINSKKVREIVFHLTVTSEDRHISVLEEFDDLLVRINQECGQQFKIYTIWNDISLFYNKKLYPQIAEIETLFRKLIYRFMIKVAGSEWFKRNGPKDFVEMIMNNARKNNITELPEQDQLIFADFIQLKYFLFEPYPSKMFDNVSVTRLKKSLEDKAGKEREVIEAFIKDHELKSNWDRYFSEKIVVDNLSDKLTKLYEYRNDIAHSKRMNNNRYNDVITLIAEVKQAFTDGLEHLDAVVLDDEQKEVISEVAQNTIGLPYPVDESVPLMDRARNAMASLGILIDRLEKYSKTEKVTLESMSSVVPALSVLSKYSQPINMDEITKKSMVDIVNTIQSKTDDDKK